MVPPPGLEYLADSLPAGIESEPGSAGSNSTSASETSQEVIANVTPDASGVDGTVGALVIEVPETDGGEADEPMATDSETS